MGRRHAGECLGRSEPETDSVVEVDDGPNDFVDPLRPRALGGERGIGRRHRMDDTLCLRGGRARVSMVVDRLDDQRIDVPHAQHVGAEFGVGRTEGPELGVVVWQSGEPKLFLNGAAVFADAGDEHDNTEAPHQSGQPRLGNLLADQLLHDPGHVD